MRRLELAGQHTRLHAALCAECPQGPAGCCVAPPEYDWSDLARVVKAGGLAWLLEQIAARRLVPSARGLVVRRVRRREHRGEPRLSKCAYHGAAGCTIGPELRPATCNYFLCDDAFREAGAGEGVLRAVHALLKRTYEGWDEALAGAVAEAHPEEGPPWDAAFFEWLGDEGAGRARAARRELEVLLPPQGSLPLDPAERSAKIPRMPKITLKLRDLSSGDTSFRELAGEDEATAFLKDRPRFTDVLGVVFEGLTREQNDRLKAAMRPLDAEEKAAEARLAEVAARAQEAAEALRAKEQEAALAAHREAMKHADPKRPMEVRYRFDSGIAPVDSADTREITPEARAAIEAWVVERNEWIESRNQVVGEAKMSVWLGDLPRPGADRVHNGSFVPVTAPKKA